MREKGSQRANVKGSVGQRRNCYVERVSKKNRERGSEQCCVLLPSASRNRVCYGGRHACATGWGTTQRHRAERRGGKEEVGGGAGNPWSRGRWRYCQGTCSMMHDAQCLLHSDLWKQQSVQCTECSRGGRMSVCCSGAACYLLQLWARGRERRGFSGESDLIQESPLFISVPPFFMFICAVRYLIGCLIYSFYVCQGDSIPDWTPLNLDHY